jgi:hypothetical protein
MWNWKCPGVKAPEALFERTHNGCTQPETVTTKYAFLLSNELKTNNDSCECVRYHHEDRTRLELGKGTPNDRLRSTAPRVAPCLMSDLAACVIIITILPWRGAATTSYIPRDRVK